MIARFTNITKSSKLMRNNSMSINEWENIFIKCKKESKVKFNDPYLDTIEKEINFSKKIILKHYLKQ